MEEIFFENWAELWLNSMRGTIKDSTFYNNYRNVVYNHLTPAFGNRKLNEILPIDVQSLLYEKSLIYSNDMVLKIRNCLSQIYKAAIINQKCTLNPCVGIKLPKGKETKEKPAYTPEQAELIFEYAYSHRYGVEVQLMLETGISRSELLGVMWEDIDLKNKVLYICRGVTDIVNHRTGKYEVCIGSTKNKYRSRAIPLSDRICDIISNIDRFVTVKGKKLPKKYLICNRYGDACSPNNWYKRRYKTFIKDMHNYYAEKNIDIPMYTPHQLRHTRASIWVNEGKNIYAVAKVLGHSDLDMLRKRYAHSDVEQLRKLLEIK